VPEAECVATITNYRLSLDLIIGRSLPCDILTEVDWKLKWPSGGGFPSALANLQHQTQLINAAECSALYTPVTCLQVSLLATRLISMLTILLTIVKTRFRR
jgi:hypothetical protein